jgi:Cofactor assembly of complex C subunit B, CCB2/CCB4
LANDDHLRPGRGRSRAPPVRRDLAAKGTTDNNNNNPVDDALRWVTSDVGSIALGSVGLVALLLSQIILGVGGASDGDSSIVVPLEVATRSNLLAVFACGAVLVNGVGKLDVKTAKAESVALQGFAFPHPVIVEGIDIDPSRAAKCWKEQSAWVLQSVLAATPASTAVMVAYEDDDHEEESSASPQWKVAGAAGILPAADVSELALPDVAATPILNKARSSGRDESYLPTLQALPGRTEFGGYLPSNTQAVLIVPVVVGTSAAGAPSTASTTPGPAQLVLVLGSDRARSYTPRDIVWCQALAARLGQTSLETVQKQ